MFILFLFIFNNLFYFSIIALPNLNIKNPSLDQNNQTFQNKFLQRNKNFQNNQRNIQSISSISTCLLCALCGLPELSLPSSSSSYSGRPTSLAPINKCEDKSSKCTEFAPLCDDGIYKHFLRSQCPYTCGICKETKINEKNITKTLKTTTLIPKTTKHIKTSLKPKITTKTFKTTLKHLNNSKENNEKIKENKKTKIPKLIKENSKEMEKTKKTIIIKTTTTIPTTIEEIISTTNESSIEENLEDCEDIGQNCKAMKSGCQDIGQRHILGTFCRKTCKFC